MSDHTKMCTDCRGLSSVNKSHVDGTVIGVLCQDLSVGLLNKFGKVYTSSLDASYVKFIEDCEAKCLPIALNQPLEYYLHIVSIVHAIILPGGSFALAHSKGYTPSGKVLLDALISSEAKGRVIPLFGICLGFELMAVYFGSDKKSLDFNILTQYRPIVYGWKQLCFPDDVKLCRLFRNDDFDKLKNNNLQVFGHRMCIELETLNKNLRLKEEWTVLATNDIEIKQLLTLNDKVTKEEEQKLAAVSMIESKSKPYFGTQFHPEKARHHSVAREQCPDIATAETAAQVFISALVEMIRAQNMPLSFPKDDTFRLINGFKSIDVRKEEDIRSDFVYMFKDNDLKVNIEPRDNGFVDGVYQGRLK